MRAMGQNPTEDEVPDILLPLPALLQVLNMMLEADLDGNGTIEFDEFLELMRAKYGTDDQESDLRLKDNISAILKCISQGSLQDIRP